MDRTEGVGHIQVGQVGHGLGQGGIIFRLAGLETGVLQQHDLAGLEGGGLGLGIGTHHVVSHDDRLAQQLAQAGGHGL